MTLYHSGYYKTAISLVLLLYLHHYDVIADKIFRLREEKADASNKSQEDLQNRITELQNFLKDQQTDIIAFIEHMVRKLIWQIIIYQDRTMIEFKSGLQITINE